MSSKSLATKKTEQYTLIIEAGKTEKHYWLDLWKYRELFFFLAWRDILVRYKQTILGIAWSVIRPFLTMLVFTIIFGKIANLSSNGVPYAIMVFVAMLPWQFFANSFTESSNSLIANANMLTKIYFPRLIMPVSSVIVSLVDFFISFIILAAIMLYYQFIPSWKIIFMPLFWVIAFFIAMGAGLIICSLNVKYRDFRYIVPFIVQIGLYVSPVGFSSSVVLEKWRLLFSLNPMVGVIDGFRWAILGNIKMYWPGFFLSLWITFLLVIIGIWYFRLMEKSFADDI